MKLKKLNLIVAGASVFTLGVIMGTTDRAQALHDGGVARCEACHTMHNSFGNAVHNANLTTKGTTGAYLLKGNDQSSACLNCHSGSGGYRVLTSGATAGTVPVNITPGGDFAWTRVDGSGDAGRNSIRGHNIIATDFGMGPDSRAGMATAPGGTYPNSIFHCSSCHDPHGRYRVLDDGSVATTGKPIRTYGSYGAAPDADSAVGAYRLLGGEGYIPKSVQDAGLTDLAFGNTIPAAVAPNPYNSSTAPGGVRVAYGSGMSEWCANCHGGFHDGEGTSGEFARHPSGNTDKLGAAIAANYNAYVKSGDMTGEQATSHLTLVPFETGMDQTDRAALTSLVTSTAGPDATANVMCLSCHRAHASGFDSMVRWNHKANVMASNGVYASQTGLTDVQIVAAYQNKPASDFATTQRSLCNKCHAKD